MARSRKKPPQPLTDDERAKVEELCELWSWILSARARLVAEVEEPHRSSKFVSAATLPKSVHDALVQAARARLDRFDRKLVGRANRPPNTLRSDWLDRGGTGPPIPIDAAPDSAAVNAVVFTRWAYERLHDPVATDGERSNDRGPMSVKLALETAAECINQLGRVVAELEGAEIPPAKTPEDVRKVLLSQAVDNERRGGAYGGGPMKAVRFAVSKLGPLTVSQLQDARDHEEERRLAEGSGRLDEPDDDDWE